MCLESHDVMSTIHYLHVDLLLETMAQLSIRRPFTREQWFKYEYGLDVWTVLQLNSDFYLWFNWIYVW